ncbi:galactose/methyl galactoside import ATP-binding protein MglA [Clostridiales bacterium]|nr:galactose/methyl galactoside import ATP-binding protein MglA [Clostridiales bacterium]
MDTAMAIELKNICKYFGEVAANRNVSLEVRKGEILSLLGENGSGKTTLMNMLAGIYFPDEGEIFVDGKEVKITCPADAFGLGIGMIHQHFKLIETFTAAENIILGLPGAEIIKMNEVVEKINDLVEKYGFDLDPRKKIYDMSVSEKQTVEIVKMLYRGANTLILDEPTAVLTPQETDKLFYVLRNMRDDGKAIIIITHKLHEVLSLSDRVSVLRKGEYIGTVQTKDATEISLTEMMVGEKVTLDIGRELPHDVVKRLEIKNLTCIDKNKVTVLDDISFEAFGGEVLGIAGIAGSGQKELLEAIAGLQPVEKGSVVYYGGDEPTELLGKTPMEIRDAGVALSFVPEDRLGMGLVANMDLADNVMLRSYREGRGSFLNRVLPRKKTEEIVEELKVVAPSISTPIRKLSGGNVQKVLVGREIANAPTVLMTAYAVRGLDINTSYTIYHLINAQKDRGVAVIYVGEDLDVLLELADRILVLCAGRVSGVVDARTATKEQIGLMMTKHTKEEI